MCNPLTSSHYACASHFAHYVVHQKLVWFSVIGPVYSVQTIMVHAVVLITVNKDQLWQYLELLSITVLWIWSHCRWAPGLLECGEQELPVRGVWCQVLPLVNFIAHLQKPCGSGHCSYHLWPKSDGPRSGTHLPGEQLWCVVLSGTFLCASGQSHAPVITLDFRFLLWCEQTFFNSLWRSKFFTCAQSGQSLPLTNSRIA